ncbi:MAG: FliI/YscN family ATPase [Deltaproteobacteria bacterium]|jgi:flagellum-specific ATP synthase|nr:FliI/YscN family ATPase [Deltaproteobacteria bacterium]
MRLDLKACERALSADDLVTGGRITRVNGSTIEALLPRAQTGSIYRIAGQGGRGGLLSEVIGFRESETILAPFGEPRGISAGDLVEPEGLTDEQRVSDHFLGRIVDPLGHPLDGGPPIEGRHVLPLYRPAPNPLIRTPIHENFLTGVSVIDAMTTFGRGQRVGIFAGAGVGKSTLMGMLARHSQSEVNVIALVGERGREVRTFIEQELGPEGLARSVLIVATGDAAPILRVRAAFLATTMAEYFRERGRQVLLMMDSLTRLAHALREIGLAAGEPPTTRGYPPSVFSTLPKLLERAGNSNGHGTMTALYTVLVDGDDLNDPVADASRSILDGHVVLSRKVAESGRYPAVDVLGSLSRVASELITPTHALVAAKVREVLSGYDEVRDLIQVGAYREGTDARVDRVVQLYPRVTDFFRQKRPEKRPLEATLGGLEALLGTEIHAKAKA